MSNRCNYSDLIAAECAHCTGATSDLPAATEHRWTFDGQHVGRVVWSGTAQHDEPTSEAVRLPATWAPSAEAGVCRCGKPTRDAAYVCDDCVGLLERVLGDVTWLDEQLDVAITKQRASGGSGGSRGTETPLPWHERASEAKTLLHALLVLWVRFCNEEHIRHNGSPDLPADTLPALSAWLLARTRGLALAEIGPEAVDEITDAVAECRRIVFYKRRSRVYLGPCEGRDVGDDEEGYVDMEPCPGEVYAEEFEPVGTCGDCGRGYTVVIKRGNLEKQLDDRLCTVAEIARLATFLGLDVPRERVRRQIHSWHKRKQIIAGGHADNGDPMFRYGSVKALLYAAYRDTA